MNLLPKDHSEFVKPEYWEQFFKKRGAKAFEWYGEYPELCGVLHKYIKPQDSILVVGCGNSQLSADLYDVGYHKIVNIDISDTVIRQMCDKNQQQRPDMKFLKMDVLNMEFTDGEFTVAVDKGTLDALMVDSSEKVVSDVEKMFEEIDRVLKLMGRYICISLLQEHILNKVIQFFADKGWAVRVHKIQTEDSGSAEKEFQMPVFALVFTKFKKNPKLPQILEVCTQDDKNERFGSVEEILNIVKEMQYYAIVRQRISKRKITEEQLSLSLYSDVAASPKYTLTIVDSTSKMANKFAIFIVPQGRKKETQFGNVILQVCVHRGCQVHCNDLTDCYSMAMKRKNKKVVQKGKKVKFGPEKTEERKTSSYAAKENYVGTFRWAKLQGLKMMWPVLVKSITPDKVLVYVKSDDDMETEWMFSTDAGRQQLSQSAGFERLVVVTLDRNHTYSDLDAIQAELSTKVMELAPPSFRAGTKVPFLSIGNDIGTRKVCKRGHSEMSGDYVIEEVTGDSGVVYRRLVFLSNQNIVQSEARLKTVSTKKKGKGRQSTQVIDKSYLACQHHVAMVAGLACVQCDDFQSLLVSSLSVLLVGLGGGGLPTYIHAFFTDIDLDVVDIDPEIVTIATEWFGFVPDDKLKVHVADGLQFIQAEQTKGKKRHVVMLDVDSKDPTVGMSCPPQPFVETQFLQCIKDSLYDGGVFILNLVCRDVSMKDSVIQRIKQIFTKVFLYQIEDEVNVIIFAFNVNKDLYDNDLMKKCIENSRHLNKGLKKGSEKSDVDIVKEFENMKIL